MIHRFINEDKKAKANTLSFSMAVLRFSDIIYIVYLYQNKHSLISEEEKKYKKNPLSLVSLIQYSILDSIVPDQRFGGWRIFVFVFSKRRRRKREEELPW
jgi:hypothetical protein